MAKSVSVEMLERLGTDLGADVGGWFRWEGSTLTWTIREAAEARDIDMPSLVWTSAILPDSLATIWRGVQQIVFVETGADSAGRRIIIAPPLWVFLWEYELLRCCLTYRQLSG